MSKQFEKEANQLCENLFYMSYFVKLFFTNIAYFFKLLQISILPTHWKFQTFQIVGLRYLKDSSSFIST